MKTKILSFSIVLLFLVTACVPTQDLIYLQDKKNTTTSAGQAVTPSNKPYRLQVNDVVSVQIKALVDERLLEIFNTSPQNQAGQTVETLYFNGYTVDDHGNIRIPILGEVNVLGYTVEEARAKIEAQLLADYFKKEAQLFVNVKLAGFRYTVNGEVNNPGSKVLYQDRVNVLEALANSGDITMTGDRKEVKVIRQFPHGLETFSIDLTDAAAIHSPAFYLQPNDYIYVKPLKQKSWGFGGTGRETLTVMITAASMLLTLTLLLRN
ncbi:polysaccharide biosynthesis/export family protein [Flavobacterium sp.]|jgi:polysaccharide export outer membrane protein|uniref:polysaccharide biosynthesis/export family protein n=1 Tax=Flavobacterium sp. TaxID=239 RepID=UPI0022C9F5CB|nr:polysaccharide biosynthesis/export family protein [Flavobacterium sp.]MCZ8145332.1 polysaccharide biosynthesis/export family protein [Flavobacterium sp.]MCZ8367881.1 polysaccharide biosynthesis/export family protein [Flavobacterium sp.]